MPNIPFTTPMAYLGIFCLILGLFLLVAGMGIIQIEKVTVSRGRQTYITGMVLLVLGGVFLISERRDPVTVASQAPSASTPIPEFTITTAPTALEKEIVITPTDPIPTNTPEPLTGTSQGSSGGVLYEEYFSPPKYRWHIGEFTFDNSTGESQYVDSQLQYSISYEEDTIYLLDTPFENIRDFDLSMDYIVDPASSGTVGFCIFFRRVWYATDERHFGYSSCIYDDAVLTFYHKTGGGYFDLENAVPDESLTKEWGQTNRIQLIVKDTNIRVYINGVKAGEYEDTAITNKGIISFGVEGDVNQKVIVRMDNIVLRELP